jgi:hypothetical protein
VTAGGSPPPGWYQDPGDTRQLRWWDGGQWTPHQATQYAPSWQLPATPYRSARVHHGVALILLVVGAGTSAVGALAFLHRARLIDDASDHPASVSIEKIADADDVLAWMTIVDVVAFLAAFVALVVFVHRLYANLPSLGATSLRYSSGWAIGGWFVPFLNFVRPKQIVNDIWRASDPQAPPSQGSSWHGRPVRQLLDLWWALLIGAGLLVRFAAASREDTSLVQLADADRVAALCEALFAIALVVTIAAVHALATRQEERATRLGVI